jgi:hypothetical protein
LGSKRLDQLHEALELDWGSLVVAERD